MSVLTELSSVAERSRPAQGPWFIAWGAPGEQPQLAELEPHPFLIQSPVIYRKWEESFFRSIIFTLMY